jgi:UDP-N-acetylmuramate dehydrogenase
VRISSDQPLAPLTTLKLGGPARRLVEVETEDEVESAIGDADRAGEPAIVLGGGSNVVVADGGFPGTVVQIALHGVDVKAENGAVRVDVAAGESWDGFVEQCIAAGWSGVECLAGIPGLVGATPIQNVGAYGQEVKETIASLRAFDREKRAFVEMDASECGFSYRSSVFKGRGRFVVVRVRFRMRMSSESAPVRYAELARALGVAEGQRAPAREVMRTVVELRKKKGMVLDASDPDTRSAGSFFVNPVLSPEGLALLERRLDPGSRLPKFPEDGGRTKISAAWLIEHAGYSKGFAMGRAAISTKHALALTNRGGATTAELLALARAIQEAVRARFGVELVPEPVLIG